MKVDVQTAKKQLSVLLHRVGRGEEIVIERDGEPIARLVPVGTRRKCAVGEDSGTFDVSDDFDTQAQSEILDTFGA